MQCRKMFTAESGSQELAVNYKSGLGKSSAFLKTGARITILSVLSRQVKNQTAVLKNSKLIKEFPEKESKLQDNQNDKFKANSMSSTDTLRIQSEGSSPAVKTGTNEVVAGNVTGNMGSARIPNGIPQQDGNDQDTNGRHANGVVVNSSSFSRNEPVVSKNCVNSSTKHGKSPQNGNTNTPFDYMKERKLSEPVISPRKKYNPVTTRMTRCNSTLELRETEKPIIRELGGYKFLQKPNDVSVNLVDRRTNSYRLNDKRMSEVAALKKTINAQKGNICSREKHVLQLEKKICQLESENLKNKKQVASLREKLNDCSGTVDFLRREKDLLASEKDRLNFTLLTYEDEIKELRSENLNLVTEYENVEQSRKIAVGHLQEVEKTYQELSKEKSTLQKNSQKFIDKLNSVKECVHKLRSDRDALQDAHRNTSLFFAENLKLLVERVREMEKIQVGDQSVSESGKNSDKERLTSVEKDVAEPDDQGKENGEESKLEEFKNRLKSNEELIDQLANEIRNLENRKKGLLESRFAMIQEFQAGRELVDTDELDGDNAEKVVDEYVEETEESRKGKPSSRVTKKIRKLERTLSMDHGVGKLDCIQKLCKKLEECEQKIHDLETMNEDLRAEHDDMEEEAKYLKYVLSYRGDVMKAQLQTEFENKMAALKEELRIAKEGSFEKSPGSEQRFEELSERNRMLEEEVQRLHEEMKSLLLNLPALQGGEDEKSGEKSDSQGNVSQNRDEIDGAVRSLEEKVLELTEEKRVLLLSMQTLTGRRGSRDLASASPDNDSSFSRNLLVMEKNLREIENENAHYVETFQRMRDVLEDDDNERISDEHRDSSKISRLKDEIQRLDEKAGAEKKSVEPDEDSFKGEEFLSRARHEERISELEKEVARLHDEKKSLLSSIIRLQTDPNFTFSDDVTEDDVTGQDSLDSPVKGAKQAVALDDVDGTAEETPLSAPIATDGVGSSSPLVARSSSRDEEVQVNINSEDLGGLLGYLERDLDRLKTALHQQGTTGYMLGTEQDHSKDPPGQGEEGIPTDVDNLNKELTELGEHTKVLQEKLDESEAIRGDLCRTISIATDMATEERQKCADLLRAKAALEKEMLKLAKENRDLRDALETLSRSRQRRNSRGQFMTRTSSISEQDENWIPRGRSLNYSESEFSDIDSQVPESNT